MEAIEAGSLFSAGIPGLNNTWAHFKEFQDVVEIYKLIKF